jgi:hypothetical protein
MIRIGLMVGYGCAIPAVWNSANAKPAYSTFMNERQRMIGLTLFG